MSLFSVLKDNSKRALGGHWGTAICALLIMALASAMIMVMRGTVIELFVDTDALDPTFAIHYGFNEYFFQRFVAASIVELAIILGFSAVGFFLLTPLRMGIARWNYEMIQGRPSTLSEMFRYFETGRRYRRCLWLELNLLVRTFLWAIPFYAVPSAILAASAMAVIYGGAQSMLGAFASVGILLSAALFLLVTVFYAATISRYALAVYLLGEDDELDVRDAIKTSVEYTRGYRFSLVWFELSFIGWLLLCVFIIPALYVGPYINASVAMYGRYIIEKGRYVPQNPTKEFRPAMEEPVTQQLDLPLEPPAERPYGQLPPSWEEEGAPPPAPEPEPWPEPDSEPLVDDFHFPPSQYPVSGPEPQEEPQQPEPFPQGEEPQAPRDEDDGWEL